MARMEHNGIRIDIDYLEKALADASSKIKELDSKLKKDEVYVLMRKRFGVSTNLASADQLAKILFGEMGYEPVDKTNTGKPKTDEEALSKIDLPFIRDYIAWKKLHKVRGTYLSGIKAEVEAGFIHPSFDLNKVVSYRSSSSNINFQNIPTRDPEIGELVRRCFIPRGGRRLVETDFAGIEVRAGCPYHQDPQMLKYLTDPKSDMHRDTACDLFFLTPEQVDKKTTRDWSKNRMVFPQFYGSVYFQCAPSLWEGVTGINPKIGDITLLKHLKKHGIKELGDCTPGIDTVPGTFVHHVKKVQESMWNKRFQRYAQWKKQNWDFYCKKGYVEILSGFRCSFSRSGVLKRNDANNYPIQGFAFHWLLATAIKVQKHLTRHKWKTKLVGQIHDSMLADVPDSELQDYLDLVHRTVTEYIPKRWKCINVPLEVEMETTPVDGTWFDKKQWIKEGGTWQKKPS